MKEIVIVRHAAVSSQADCSLAEDLKGHQSDLAQVLLNDQKFRPQRVFSSPKCHARLSASLMVEYFNNNSADHENGQLQHTIAEAAEHDLLKYSEDTSRFFAFINDMNKRFLSMSSILCISHQTTVAAFASAAKDPTLFGANPDFTPRFSEGYLMRFDTDDWRQVGHGSLTELKRVNYDGSEQSVVLAQA